MENKIIRISLIPGNLLIAIFLVMFVMKLAEVGAPAGWSWWIVTFPLWIMPAVVLGILGIVGVVFVVGFAAYKIRYLFD